MADLEQASQPPCSPTTLSTAEESKICLVHPTRFIHLGLMPHGLEQQCIHSLVTRTGNPPPPVPRFEAFQNYFYPKITSITSRFTFCFLSLGLAVVIIGVGIGVSSFRGAGGPIRMTGASRSRTIRSSISYVGGVSVAWEMFSALGPDMRGLAVVSALNGWRRRIVFPKSSPESSLTASVDCGTSFSASKGKGGGSLQ